jgi:malonate transporter and related proteins
LSNNVLLGLPLAAALLGEDALPSVALVLGFNSLVLWTLVTASVEWARHGAVSRSALAGTVRSVLTNPVIAGILAGTAFGLTGASLPTVLDEPLRLLAGAAIPLALVALGAGLVQHDVRSRWQVSTGITILKLVACPLVVWGLAVALGLPPLETQVVTLLASVSVGTNVYLMANRFESLQGPVAASLVLSTALSALTTPLMVTLVAA